MSENGKKACCTPASRSSEEARTSGGQLKRGEFIDPRSGLKLVEVELAERVEEAREGSTQGMVQLDGGHFLMGTTDEDRWDSDGEGPVREVQVAPFWIDATGVSNADFTAFIEATGYETDAERFGWSFVFFGQLSEKRRKQLIETNTVEGLQWWYAIEGAQWRAPEGRGSHIKKRMEHPVVHVSWNDAQAYCRWAGKRLAREAEYEFAGRGGLVQKRYCWGDELTPEGKHRCNIWQGNFPHENTAEDGYAWTAPVKNYKANGYGLYNMSGNVWEWCGDWFSPDWHATERSETRENPRGPEDGRQKVMRGGSFLCHDSYCNRYRVAARTSNDPDSGASNLGFRCVRDV